MPIFPETFTYSSEEDRSIVLAANRSLERITSQTTFTQ